MQGHAVIPRTIRWRLPLSYAAIALIATLALGAVLLLTLRSYYDQGERDYLQGNAQAISTLLAEWALREVPQEALDTQLQNIAFISQVRIQLLDSDHTIINDTGLPEDNILTFAPDSGLRAMRVELPPAPRFDEASGLWTSRFDPDRFDVRVEQRGNYTIEIIQQSLLDDDLPISGGSNTQDVLFYVPARRSLFGFNLDGRFSDPSQRSNQIIETTLPTENPFASFVHISQGPAYGTEIINGVARGWLIASGFAIILAALVGLIISRQISTPLTNLTNTTLRMAEGDLSARAAIVHRDEVGTLSQSFNIMAGRVEETISALRRFVADAAHELHTPLTALRTNIELIGEESAVEKRQLFMKNALAQVVRLEALTNDLLELSRIESSKTPIPAHPVNLNAFLIETSEIYASQAEQANIDFQVDLPPETIIVNASESQIRHALCNLLDNALKFTPSDGAIHLGLCLNGDHMAEIWVQDTGIGIPEDDLPQLFSRFHRGRNAYAYPGSGLGLAIVKAIADAHLGSVTATNTSAGTRLALRLPA